MKKRLIVAAALAAFVAAPVAHADSVKIGFINTFSGGLAIFGKHQKDAVELALDHLGRKLGGLDVEMVYGDDQAKPDVGRQVAVQMLQKTRSISSPALSGRTFWRRRKTSFSKPAR